MGAVPPCRGPGGAVVLHLRGRGEERDVKSRRELFDPGLRRRAEERVAARGDVKPGPAEVADLRRLVHELEVHEIELEMQNDQLRTARAEVEAGMRRYATLFELAPMGYAVLDAKGVICDANLEVARYLDC